MQFHSTNNLAIQEKTLFYKTFPRHSPHSRAGFEIVNIVVNSAEENDIESPKEELLSIL
jgi:hypothetical protein